MKVIHTVGGFDSTGGGVTSSLRQLLDALQARDGSYRLLTVEGSLNEAYPDWVDTVPNDYFTPLCLSRNLRRALKNAATDILHTNGLWMHINHLTAAEARRRDIPLVITTHGMLYPEALRRSGWKKQLMGHIWFDNDVARATAVHVTCDDEKEHVEDFGYKGKIEVIPNPVTVPDFIPDVIKGRHDSSKINFGFLGRIDPRKGIDILIKAFASASITDSSLIIIGTGSPQYEKSLRRLANSLGVADRVYFTGHITGRRKFEWLAKLDALFVTSGFENFGMIIPEALMVETPVFASDTTPWQMLEETGSGWWRPRDVDTLVDTMRQIAATPRQELREMGRRGARTVAERFAAPTVASRMVNLYRSLL